MYQNDHQKGHFSIIHNPSEIPTTHPKYERHTGFKIPTPKYEVRGGVSVVASRVIIPHLPLPSQVSRTLPTHSLLHPHTGVRVSHIFHISHFHISIVSYLSNIFVFLHFHFPLLELPGAIQEGNCTFSATFV